MATFPPQCSCVEPSQEELPQQVLLVDLAHLIPWHFTHHHQACGDGVCGHVDPATKQ